MKAEKNPLSAKTRQELADEYQVSARTFRRRLKRHKISLPQGLVMPSFIRKIYQTFGEPFHQK